MEISAKLRDRETKIRVLVDIAMKVISKIATIFRVQNSSRHFGHSCRWFFTQEIEKKCNPIPWLAKSMSLERLSKHFISVSKAAMKHSHTYQKWIWWRFKSFLNKTTNYKNVNQVFVLATISIYRHSSYVIWQQRDFWGNRADMG